jgi:hypothetical protein
MVERNVTVDHRFVCLTNTKVPCESISLENDWRGWWSKIELFRPGLFEGRVFYLDLDTVILSNIDELLEQEDNFIALKPFNPYRAELPGYFGSGLMSWEVGDFDYLYEEFDYEARHKYPGDQDYLVDKMRKQYQSVAYWQELVDGIYSYKRHIRLGVVTASPRVVCFHGRPRPWNVKVYENIIGK